MGRGRAGPGGRAVGVGGAGTPRRPGPARNAGRAQAGGGGHRRAAGGWRGRRPTRGAGEAQALRQPGTDRRRPGVARPHTRRSPGQQQHPHPPPLFPSGCGFGGSRLRAAVGFEAGPQVGCVGSRCAGPGAPLGGGEARKSLAWASCPPGSPRTPTARCLGESQGEGRGGAARPGVRRPRARGCHVFAGRGGGCGRYIRGSPVSCHPHHHHHLPEPGILGPQSGCWAGTVG